MDEPSLFLSRDDLDRLPDIFSDDRYLYGKAMEFIRDHPGHAARLYLRKLGNIFALYPETLTGTYVNPASRWGQGVASVIIFAGALLALVRLRSEPALWPMVLGSLTFVLATALVLSSMRYRLIVEPVLILMAAVGFARAWPSGRSVGAA